MRLIDELYTLHPFYGVRQITRRVNFKRVRRLLRLLGLVALCRPTISAQHDRIYAQLATSD